MLVFSGAVIQRHVFPAGSANLEIVVPEELPQIAVETPPSAPTRPYANISGYRGARVDAMGTAGHPIWELTYDDQRQRFFKALTLDVYDRRQGWLRRAPEATGPYASRNCGPADCVEVQLRVGPQRSVLVLPVPTGYRVDTGSISLDDRPVQADLRTNVHGEALLPLTTAAGLLRYRVGRAAETYSGRLGARPDLPRRLRGALDKWQHLPAKKQVRRVNALIQRLVDYDVSVAASQAFDTAEGTWLARVLKTGAGDCDVKNGLNVLALRYLRIPARLAIGIPGFAGMARPGLHAWTEYYLNGRWRSIDVSGTPRLPTGSSQPAVSGALPEFDALSPTRGPERANPSPVRQPQAEEMPRAAPSFAPGPTDSSPPVSTVRNSRFASRFFGFCSLIFRGRERGDLGDSAFVPFAVGWVASISCARAVGGGIGRQYGSTGSGAHPQGCSRQRGLALDP